MKSLAIFLLSLLSLGAMSCTDGFAENESLYDIQATEGDDGEVDPGRPE